MKLIYWAINCGTNYIYKPLFQYKTNINLTNSFFDTVFFKSCRFDFSKSERRFPVIKWIVYKDLHFGQIYENLEIDYDVLIKKNQNY